LFWSLSGKIVSRKSRNYIVRSHVSSTENVAKTSKNQIDVPNFATNMSIVVVWKIISLKKSKSTHVFVVNFLIHYKVINFLKNENKNRHLKITKSKNTNKLVNNKKSTSHKNFYLRFKFLWEVDFLLLTNLFVFLLLVIFKCLFLFSFFKKLMTL
jgi:hypothetical protein